MAVTADKLRPGGPRSLMGIVDFATRSHARAVLVLVVLAFLSFLPGFVSIPPIDRDEARYAQASRQMMETGNYLDIRFQNEPRYLQPVGIYWLQVAAAKVTGFGERAPIWVHRIPSLLGATAAVVLTYWTVLPIAGAVGALIAALFMAASLLLGMEARLAKTDAVLLAATLGAMGVLARAYLGQVLSLAAAMGFWAALAGGILIKGPIILLVVGATTLALVVSDRSAGWLKVLRPVLGIGLLLLLVLPWFAAIATISGGDFFLIAIFKSMLGKVAAGQQSHGAPPGTYLMLFWLTFAPASLFAVFAAPWAWKNRGDRAVKFCLAWIVPTWAVFELIVTKLPHYVLPTYPAIAALIALAMLNGKRLGSVLGTMLIVATVVTDIAACVALFWLEGTIAPAAIIVLLAVIGVLVWGVRNEPSISPLAFAATLAIAGVMQTGAIVGLIAPKMDSLWLSSRLAQAVTRHAECAAPQVSSASFHQPSLVFLMGTTTRMEWPSDAASFLARGGCRLALINEQSEDRFIAELSKLGHSAVLAERVTGFNLGKFGRESIGIYRPQGS